MPARHLTGSSISLYRRQCHVVTKTELFLYLLAHKMYVLLNDMLYLLIECLWVSEVCPMGVVTVGLPVMFSELPCRIVACYCSRSCYAYPMMASRPIRCQDYTTRSETLSAIFVEPVALLLQ